MTLTIRDRRAGPLAASATTATAAPAGPLCFAAEALVAELARAERAGFRQRAGAAAPPNQLLCGGSFGPPLSAACAAPDAGTLAGHRPAMAALPRVIGLAFAPAGDGDGAVVEEGLVSLRAHGSAPWLAAFIVERAVQRGWRSLWACGDADFRREVIAQTQRQGLTAFDGAPADEI